MYKVLKIGGKDYKLEYTVEASLYDDCVSSVTSLMVGISESEDKNDIKKLVKEISNIPKTTLIIFYAGLLEAHGPEGDGTVSDLKDAKSLIRTYLEEHKDDEDGNFYGIMTLCIEKMGEDNFFDLIGLNKMLWIEPEQKKEPKKPQDHKKKTAKAEVTEK